MPISKSAVKFTDISYQGSASAEAPAPWALPKAPDDPTKTSQVHVLAHAPAPRLVRVCYLKGPADSYVAARANTNGGGNVATNIFLGSCVDIGGTDIEVTNPNETSVSGTYLLLPDNKSSGRVA